MCVDCGCSAGAKAVLTDLTTGKVHEMAGTGHSYHHHDHDHDGHHHHHGDGHHHHHDHDHDHPHDHGHAHDGHRHGDAVSARGVVDLETALLAKNDALAQRNRAWLEGHEVLMLNLVSSPGSGKTSLLERTIRDLKDRLPISVIEGDQATANDGERIKAAGAPAIQVNTGTGCHLEADMIRGGLDALKPKPGSLVLVENVGNLVCPALFDLGEKAKVAILSVTEGEDKPLKYPHMFRAASLLLLNKIDLLPHLDFDIDKAIASARAVNPEVTIIQCSAKSGEGLAAWYRWIDDRMADMRV